MNSNRFVSNIANRMTRLDADMLIYLKGLIRQSNMEVLDQRYRLCTIKGQ